MKFSRLSDEFIASGIFEHGKASQRFFYKGSFPVDIVPFGGISDPDGFVRWPQTDGIEMGTLGFKESYGNSVLVRLRSSPILEIKFASLAGLAAMKMISWKEKYPERSKDAKDLEFIMCNYIDAGNFNRVYDGKASDLLADEDFDYELASARLLGRDVAQILKRNTKDTILNILDEETAEKSRYRLVTDMRDAATYVRNDFDERLGLLQAFKKGFLERL